MTCSKVESDELHFFVQQNQQSSFASYDILKENLSESSLLWREPLKPCLLVWPSPLTHHLILTSLLGCFLAQPFFPLFFCLSLYRASTLSNAVSSLANTGISFTKVDEREKQAALEEEQSRLRTLKVCYVTCNSLFIQVWLCMLRVKLLC